MAGAYFRLLLFILVATACVPVQSSAQAPVIATFDLYSLSEDFRIAGQSYMQDDSGRHPLIVGLFAHRGMPVMMNINGKIEKLRCRNRLKGSWNRYGVFFNERYRVEMKLISALKLDNGSPNAYLTVTNRKDGMRSQIPIVSNVWMVGIGNPKF